MSQAILEGMIRRQATLQPVSLLVIAALLLLLALAVGRQLAVQGAPAHLNATGTVHEVVAAPVAEPAPTGGSVKRTVTAAPGRAPVAPPAAGQTAPERRSNPGTASQCPSKPGSDLVCSAP
jgi:hypothetical protein